MIFFAAAFTGCAGKEEVSKPDGEGYIFELNDKRVLILDRLREEDSGKSWNDIFQTYQGTAIWLKTDASGLKAGQKVRYWIDGPVAESFPSQGSAKKIESINE